MTSLDHDSLEDDHEASYDGSAPNSPNRGRKKKENGAMRKAPQAPKRFKSSYICFFIAKQPEIKEELGEDANVASVSKRSAEMWKNLSLEERKYWEDVAQKDKQRYMVEKASYTGPWHVPYRRAKKDPSAPKRPMSAFLFFSLGKRAILKKQHPDLRNTEISRLLGNMWKEASEDEKRPHIEKEKAEREKYKVKIAEWRKEFEAKQEAQRSSHADMSIMQTEPAIYDAYPPPHMTPGPYMYPHGYQYPPFMPGPYPFPTNGKTPVVLGPNGMPHSYPPPATVPYEAHHAHFDGGFDYEPQPAGGVNP